MVEKIDRYESSDLAERHKVALRLTDAFVTDPNRIDDDLRAQLLAHFTPEQIVELLLDIVSWTLQKVQVALGFDAPVEPGRLAVLDFDEEGHSVIAGPVA